MYCVCNVFAVFWEKVCFLAASCAIRGMTVDPVKYLCICIFVYSRMCAFVSLLPSSTRPCQVVQLAHPVQPWEGAQLLHLLFRVWPWTGKPLFCTDGMGLPCELRYQQQRLFSFSLAFSSKNLFFVPHDDWGIIILTWTWDLLFLFQSNQSWHDDITDPVADKLVLCLI